jgi:hypothetical protein
MLLPLLLAVVLCAAAPAPAIVTNINLEVSISRQKITTNNQQGTGHRRAEFAEASVLEISIAANGPPLSEVTLDWYFVARDLRKATLSFYGRGSRTITAMRVPQKLSVPSDALSSTLSRNNSTGTYKSGTEPAGWVVIATHKGQVMAIKGSTPEMINWVRQNAK